MEDLSDRLALILLLVQERFLHGTASKWHVYMQRLPDFNGDVSGPSFLWSEEEISLLQEVMDMAQLLQCITPLLMNMSGSMRIFS